MLSKLGIAAGISGCTERSSDKEVAVMTLWNELGGRTWSVRVGPRSASTELTRRRLGRRRQLVRPHRQARVSTRVAS
jgi:hypothetical protein